MILLDLKNGGYFKLANKNHKRNRLYVKSEYTYEYGTICFLYGKCDQFIFDVDTEIVEYDPLSAFLDYEFRVNRNKH